MRVSLSRFTREKETDFILLVGRIGNLPYFRGLTNKTSKALKARNQPNPESR
jgi:hypothetical protein